MSSRAYQEIIEIYKPREENRKIRTVPTLFELGCVLKKQERYEDAQKYYLEAFEIAQAEDIEYINYAAARFDLGDIYYALGRIDEAILEYKQSLELRENGSYGDVLGIAVLRCHLADIYCENDQLGDALGLYLKVLETYTQYQGQLHENVAFALEKIGEIQFKTKNFSASLVRFKRAMKIRVHNNGRDHHGLARPYHMIGMIYNILNNNEKAIKYFDKYLQLMEVLQGTDEQIYDTYYTLGTLYWREGNFDRATHYLETLLLRHQEVKGFSHPDTGEILILLARSLQERGRFEEAITHYEKLFEISWDSEQNKENVAKIKYNMGLCFLNLQKLESALEQFTDTQDLQTQAFEEDGSESFHFWEISLHIGCILYELEKYAPAVQSLEKALEIHEGDWEAHTRQYINLKLVLARALVRMLNYDLSLEAYECAVGKLKEDNESQLLELAVVHRETGLVYIFKGELELAALHLEKSLSIQKEVHQTWTVDMLKALNDAAVVYQKAGQGKLAIERLMQAYSITKAHFPKGDARTEAAEAKLKTARLILQDGEVAVRTVAQEPSIQEPAAEEPVIPEPAVEEPLAEDPATKPACVVS